MSKTETNAAEQDAAESPKGDVKKGKTVKVRVLLDCAYGKCNKVVELATDVAKQAEKDGMVDTNADAIAAAQAE